MVLFAWMQFLKEETLTYLNIVSPFELKMGPQKKVQRRPVAQAPPGTELGLEGATAADVDQEEAVDERAVQDVESLSTLIQEILDFNQAQQTKCFNSKLFLCSICFCEKLGSECMYFLECKHVYCKACLKDYFEIQIKDGQVKCLNCPEPQCSSVATPGQVLSSVDIMCPPGPFSQRETEIFLLFPFEIGSFYIAQTGLKLRIPLASASQMLT